MNFLQAIIGILGISIESYCVYNFFDAVLGKSKIKQKTRIIIYILYPAIILILKFLSLQSMIVSVIVYFFIILLSFLYYKSVIIRIISSTIIMICMILTEMLAGMLLVLLTSKSVDFLQTNTFYYLQGMFISKFMLLIVVKALKYYKFSSAYQISKFLFVPLMSLPISTGLIIYTISEFAASITETKPIFLIGFAILLLIISNFLVFYLFEKNLKSESDKRKAQLIEQQLETQAQYFKDLSEKQKLSNKAIHDTKNQLFAISILLSNKETEAAKVKIDELCNNVFNTINVSRTGNDAIDALINSKYQLIQKANIKFQSNFIISPINQVDDIELCIALGNALDNSIEACQKIVSGEKEICIKAIQINDYLSLEISNTIAEPVSIENGRPVTTKKDKELHGFGLQSIEEIVKKYDGHMNISQENNWFHLKIYMRNIISSPILQK